MPFPSLSSSWTLLALAVGCFVFARYLVRVPYEYPLRGLLLKLAVLGLLGSGGLLLVRVVPVAVAMAQGAEHAGSRWLAGAPVDALSSYVPLPPGAAEPRAGEGSTLDADGTQHGGHWLVRTSRDADAVVRFYTDPAHRTGWAIELSTHDGLILKRAVRRFGTAGVERMRIHARPAGKGGADVEFRLTRRF